MKRYLYPIVIMAAVMSAFCLVSCSKADETDEEGIFRQKPVSEDVRDFFNLLFPSEIRQSLYDLESDEDTIVRVVNSLEEFQAHYLGEVAIPDINFDDYTLVCGRVLMPMGPFYVKYMELNDDVSSSHLILHTYHDNLTFQLAYHMYFWGLFPKKPYNIISVDVIKEYPS